MSYTQKTSGDSSHRVLVLVPSEHSRAQSGHPTTPAPTAPTEEAAELARLRAQLEEALEEVAFLREQLGSAESYHAHLVAMERAQHRAAGETLVRELAIVIEGIEGQTRPKPVATDATGGERGSAPDVSAVDDEAAVSGR